MRRGQNPHPQGLEERIVTILGTRVTTEDDPWEYLFIDFERAGGIPSFLKELSPLLETEVLTVTGRSIAENIAGAKMFNSAVIRSLEDPLAHEGGIAILKGSLAPGSAVVKSAAVAPEMMIHEGPGIRIRRRDDGGYSRQKDTPWRRNRFAI